MIDNTVLLCDQGLASNDQVAADFCDASLSECSCSGHWP